MNLRNVDTSLQSISSEFIKLEEKREIILKETRDVTRICRNAIGNIHSGDLDSTKTKLIEANSILTQLRKTDSKLHRYLVPPETEYVEAYVLYNIFQGKTIPSKNFLKVESSSYLLGLNDAMGEVKRLIYDSIRRGDGKRAEKLFNFMESLYVKLAPYSVYDNLAHGLKKKLDVSRAILESVRAAITEEVRRSEFMNAVENLSEKLP